MNRPLVFVSHSHKDDEFGHKFVDDLREGLGGDNAVWYDSKGGLWGGDEWWQKIMDEITSRPVFVIVVSTASMASEWVKSEIAIAWKQKHSLSGKLIIPVRIEGCEMRQDLDTLQSISFMPPEKYEDSVQKVLASIRHYEATHQVIGPTGTAFRERREADNAMSAHMLRAALRDEIQRNLGELNRCWRGVRREGDILSDPETQTFQGILRLAANALAQWDRKIFDGQADRLPLVLSADELNRTQILYANFNAFTERHLGLISKCRSETATALVVQYDDACRSIDQERTKSPARRTLQRERITSILGQFYAHTGEAFHYCERSYINIRQLGNPIRVP